MALKNITKLALILLLFTAATSVYSQEARSNKVAFFLNNLPDSLPPSIEIISPVLDSHMSYKSGIEIVNITGVVKDDGRVRFIALNSEKLAITEAGVFSSRIMLHPGKNEIRLVASDTKNNLQEMFVIIEYSPPLLSNIDKKKKRRI